MLQRRTQLPHYASYCLFYATAILCNKFVLTSLGFQYPTIFQGWQTFTGIVMIHAHSGNVLKDVTLSEVVPWIPATMLYIGSIYSGSRALSHLSVPLFLLSHGASDAILILCDSSLPTGAVHVSLPLKISGFMLALWSAHYDSPVLDLTWVVVYILFGGVYRTVTFWYTSPHGPHSGLTVMQRQYLNNTLGFILFVILAAIFGHHNNVRNTFPHLDSVEFYIGCLCSGVLSWAVNLTLGNIAIKASSSTTEMVQLAAKIVTLTVSMQIFPVTHTLMLWSAILLSISGDLLHILGKIMEDTGDPGVGMSDVMIGS